MSELTAGLKEVVLLCDRIEAVLLAPPDEAPQSMDLTNGQILLLARMARQVAKSQFPVAEQVESAFFAAWMAHDSTMTPEEGFARYLLGKEEEERDGTKQG